MKQVYLASDPADAQIVLDHLVSAGIPAEIRGYYLMGAWGELPVNSLPSVWVMDDEDLARAENIIHDLKQLNSRSQLFHTSWKCKRCGESIDAQFTQCWNCGDDRAG